MIKKIVREEGINLIHARAYIPAFLALLINKIIDTPFIFDMRALWPEELINSKRIRRDSKMHRIILKLEKLCLKNSAAIVSLTNAAVDHLTLIYPNLMKNKQVAIIPTCADLEKFIPLNNKEQSYNIYGCIGTILSSWFLKDWLATWIKLFHHMTQIHILKLLQRMTQKNS